MKSAGSLLSGWLCWALLLIPFTASASGDGGLAPPPAAGQQASPAQTASPPAAAAPTADTAPPATAPESEAQDASAESRWISDVRQLTFEGRRAGEGYFSADGRRMVFQSEREPGNPFYQIYVMDLTTGDVQRISPGFGKTTCAWIHPDGDRVLFASTHGDPEAREKQQQEIELRQSGRQRRYAWDYDPTFEIYHWDADTGDYTQLTDARGYDAEGSYSPDGSQIVFASNRQAYQRQLSERESEQFRIDPASMIDLYIMDADGGNVRRLTDSPGYDGGPFFSPDGQRICWRRFSEDGATAEIYTMRADGSDVQRLTQLKAMSWAPFYHPSGDYLIFTTNKHGFGNFELYVVRADGQKVPVRVTETDGFDGLPVFLPDGQRIAWTSNRGSSGRSQIFLGRWNDAHARQQLGLDQAGQADRAAALATAQSSTPDFSAADVGRHVDYLTRPELGGRLTGTEGERRATAYVAAYLESLGFEPAGEDGGWYQTFEFPAGAELTDQNRLTADGQSYELGEAWRPLSFSGSGDFDPASLVFAGYGMAVPAGEDTEEYDSYVHLDVAGKWVLVLRDLPQEISPEQRQHMARYSTPQRKAALARDHGARGIIFVAGPTSKVRNQLIRFERDASQAGVSIAVVSVTNEVAAQWLRASGKDLEQLQRRLDDGSPQMGIALKDDLQVAATIGIRRNTGVGRNVLGRLPANLPKEAAASDAPAASPQMVIIGAHIDHLGVGGGSSSLATDEERDQVHVGADDNASGVAAMLEAAQYLAAEQRAGRLDPRRDLLIAGWSGEELGLFGSQAFVQQFYELYPNAPQPASAHHGHPPADPHAAANAETKPDPHAKAKTGPHADGGRPAGGHGSAPGAAPLDAAIAAYVNLDMVGRLREKLVVQGIGSSPQWAGEVQRRNVPVGLKLELDKTSTRLPTDAAAFVARDVPILAMFTGAHEDYHTPRDTPDKLNYEGAAQIAKLVALVTRGLLTADAPPPFELDEGEQQQEVPRARLTAYMGTIPDYASGDVLGVKLSGVASEGPAAKAGMRGGDVIVEVAGRKIENLYDYTYAIEALKIGQPVTVVVMRDGKKVELQVTPQSRD